MTTAALLGAALWPRAGHPVMLALAPGVSAAGAFLAPEWRVQALQSAGPFTLVLATPDAPTADPALLRRAAGALFSISAAPGAACSTSGKAR